MIEAIGHVQVSAAVNRDALWRIQRPVSDDIHAVLPEVRLA